MVAADILVIQIASVGTGTLYHVATLGSHGDIGVFLGTGLLVGYLVVSVLQVRGAYQPSKMAGPHTGFGELTFVWLGVFLSLAGIAFVLHVSASFSRGAVLSFFAVGFAGLWAVRASMGLLTRRALDDGLLNSERIIFIGHEDAAADIDHVRELRRYGYRIVHNVTLPADADERCARKIIAEVLALAKTQHVDEVVLALQWSKMQLIDRIVVGLRRLPLPVRLLPDRVVRHLIHLPTSDLGASMALELQRGPLTTYQRALKRVFDLAAASLGLLAISPLLLTVALIIKTDSPGPVFFRQVRTGYSGRAFRIFKFRTMKVLENGEVVTQARKDDDRVTRCGRWLRRTSIDELPQLINVLLGDMSLVGPRPHALAHDVEYDKLIDDYGLRFQVKPGITGWAQVNGYRGQTATVDLMMSRVECDLWYISNWSLMLDIRTLVRTFGAQLKAHNAY
jgi:undecaprenyl-phosphate galactose phosphotransferase/putative colanic acid biosynthesis UDP-glucose lipid carrier transferase